MSKAGRFPVPVTTAEISSGWLRGTGAVRAVSRLCSGFDYSAIGLPRDRFWRKCLAAERGFGERIFARTVREALDLREIA